MRLGMYHVSAWQASRHTRLIAWGPPGEEAWLQENTGGPTLEYAIPTVPISQNAVFPTVLRGTTCRDLRERTFYGWISCYPFFKDRIP